MPDLKEAAAQFRAALTEALAGNAGDVTSVIAEAAALVPSEVAQFKFDEGHRSATGNKASTIRTLEAEKAALETKLQKAEDRAQAAEANVPDAESIKAPYVAEIADLTAQLEAKDADYAAKIAQRDADSFAASLTGDLKAVASTDGADWFDLQVEKMKHAGRIRRTETGFEVMQPGKDIPYAATDADALRKLVASEIVSQAPAWAKRSDVDGGGGATNGGTAATGGTVGERLAAQAKARKAAPPADSTSAPHRAARFAPATA